jgi:hypothetical protein
MLFAALRIGGRSLPGKSMKPSTRQGPPKHARGTAQHLEALLDILAEELVERYLVEADAEAPRGGNECSTGEAVPQ